VLRTCVVAHRSDDRRAMASGFRFAPVRAGQAPADPGRAEGGGTRPSTRMNYLKPQFYYAQ